MQNSYGALTKHYHLELAKNFRDSFVDHPTYAFIAKASPWTDERLINNISQSNPVVVTSYSHGLTNGDSITISGVNGMVQMNALGPDQVVTNATADTFEIYGVSSVLFSTYFNGGVISKSLENSFPDVMHTELDDIKIRREILFLKRMDVSNTSLTVPYVPWVANKKYAAIDPSFPSIGQFYVTNSFGDVYICIDNGNAKRSTIEPDNVSYGTFKLADGFTWKYLFSMSTADMVHASTIGWMRVRRLEFDNSTNQWMVQQTAIPGRITSVVVESAGFSYKIGDAVTAVGDGKGFIGRVSATGIGGTIQAVEILDGGYNFTNSEFRVASASGTSATLRAVLSSGSGIGSDAEKDLSCSRVMISLDFVGEEGGLATTDGKIRKIGMIRNLTLTNGEEATASAYDMRIKVRASTSSSTLPNIGPVIAADFDGYVTNVTGTLDNHTIYMSEVTTSIAVGQTFSVGDYYGTITEIILPVANALSGEVIYTENRSPLSRATTGTETLNIILAF